MEQQTGSKLENAGLDDSQAGIKIAEKNINNLRYAYDTTLMSESEEELKSILRKVKGEWKVWLKTQNKKIQNSKNLKFKK